MQHLTNIGIEKDTALNYIFPNLNNTINKLSKFINTKPHDATVKILPNTEKVFHIKQEQVGKTLNKQDMYNQIYAAYLANKPLNFKVKTISKIPEVKKLNKIAFSTDSHSSGKYI